jgi:hypothetical protein
MNPALCGGDGPGSGRSGTDRQQDHAGGIATTLPHWGPLTFLPAQSPLTLKFLPQPAQATATLAEAASVVDG